MLKDCLKAFATGYALSYLATTLLQETQKPTAAQMPTDQKVREVMTSQRQTPVPRDDRR